MLVKYQVAYYLGLSFGDSMSFCPYFKMLPYLNSFFTFTEEMYDCFINYTAPRIQGAHNNIKLVEPLVRIQNDVQ